MFKFKLMNSLLLVDFKFAREVGDFIIYTNYIEVLMVGFEARQKCVCFVFPNHHLGAIIRHLTFRFLGSMCGLYSASAFKY